MFSVFKCFVLVLRCNTFVVIVFLSDEPRQNQGRGLVDRKLVKVKASPPLCNFITGCPTAALLFWFFVDFGCGVLLFMVILFIYINTK